MNSAYELQVHASLSVALSLSIQAEVYTSYVPRALPPKYLV